MQTRTATAAPAAPRPPSGGEMIRREWARLSAAEKTVFGDDYAAFVRVQLAEVQGGIRVGNPRPVVSLSAEEIAAAKREAHREG